MRSVWQETCKFPKYPRLEKDISTDVLIIGGGIAGILCAYYLRNAGIDAVVAEAKTLCSGITEKTTAKITVQHGLIYDSVLSRFGRSWAKLYYDAQAESLSAYRELCRSIDCDFEEIDSFVYARDCRGAEKIQNEYAALQKIGVNAQIERDVPLPFSVTAALRMGNQAQFHPLKFLCEISKGLTVYEHTCVRELIGTTAVTDRGKIHAKKVIVATHFPFLNKHGLYFLKMYQHRSYVLALEGVPNICGMYVDESESGFSFRHYRDLLLLGGGGHRTGKKGASYQALESFAKRYYPYAKIRYRFATQDCMTLDGMPYIGPYSASTKDLYAATGFNKWGMTNAMTAARLLTDQITGRKNSCAELFSPSRSILRPQLFVNAGESVLHILAPFGKRCPHLGCKLTWNASEHSWDCPCHGSRFTEDGELIDNPAAGDLKK